MRLVIGVNIIFGDLFFMEGSGLLVNLVLTVFFFSGISSDIVEILLFKGGRVDFLFDGEGMFILLFIWIVLVFVVLFVCVFFIFFILLFWGRVLLFDFVFLEFVVVFWVIVFGFCFG